MLQIRQFFSLPHGPARLATGAASVLAVSMTNSPFLLSIGMWLLVAAALWEAWLHCADSIGARPGIGRVLLYTWHRFVAFPHYWVFSMLFLTVALSGLWSEDFNFWLERTRIRIPFVVLPWAMANLPQLSWRQYCAVPSILVASLVLICIGVGVNFWLDPETILWGLREGQPVPVPRHHIRFSLILTIGVLAGGWLWSKGFYWKYPVERHLVPAAVIFLFVFIHFLSVRSGLVALYAALLFTVVRFIHKTRLWRWAVLAGAVVITIPIIAVTTMPSLQQRIAYMRHDWNSYKTTGGENYSDSERFVSLHVGAQIGLDHPLIGIGMGDLETATANYTRKLYPAYRETPKMPHNQFVFIWAGLGAIGFLLSCWALFYHTVQQKYYRFYPFIIFQVVVLISFLVEYTLETAIGAAFYVFYQLWWMKMAEMDVDTKSIALP
jgi:O-antigen ligase